MLTAFVGLGAAPVLILIRYEEMVRFHALPAVRLYGVVLVAVPRTRRRDSHSRSRAPAPLSH